METYMLRSCVDAIGDEFMAEGVRLHQRRQPGRVAVATGIDARGVPALTPGLAGEAPPPPLSPHSRWSRRRTRSPLPTPPDPRELLRAPAPHR